MWIAIHVQTSMETRGRFRHVNARSETAFIGWTLYLITKLGKPQPNKVIFKKLTFIVIKHNI